MRRKPTFFSQSNKSTCFASLYDNVVKKNNSLLIEQARKALEEFKNAILDYEQKVETCSQLLQEKKSKLSFLYEKYKSHIGDELYIEQDIAQTQVDISFLVYSLNQENPRKKLEKLKKQYQELVLLINKEVVST